MKLICKNQYYEGDCVISKSNSLKESIILLENLLTATNHFSLMNELNNLQNNCRGKDGNTMFPDKYTVPVMIVNLIIQRFNLRLID